MRNFKELKIEEVVCDECGVKPDTVYFNSETSEVLAILCDSCLETINNTLRTICNVFYEITK